MGELRELFRDLFAATERWLFDPVPNHALLINRVGLGLVLFLAYGSRIGMIDVLYGPEGMVGAAFFEGYPEEPNVGWPGVYAFTQLRHVQSIEFIYALYTLLLASSLAFAAGLWPRVTGTAALVLHILFVGRNPGATWGWATMIKPFLFYATLAARRDQWSILHAIRSRRGESGPTLEWTIAGWPLRLLQVHVACVFFVLWDRFDEGSWLEGQMLSAALVSRDWGRLDIDWFPYFEWLEYAGVAALVLECGAAIMLWVPKIGRWWALALIGMFATLVVTTAVGWWDFMMLFALTAFLPNEWLAAMLRPIGMAPAEGATT